VVFQWVAVGNVLLLPPLREWYAFLDDLVGGVGCRVDPLGDVPVTATIYDVVSALHKLFALTHTIPRC